MTHASTNVCVQCKKPFTKRTKESHQKYVQRIYCSRACVDAFSAEIKQKNIERRKEGKKPLSLMEARLELIPNHRSLLRNPEEGTTYEPDSNSSDLAARINRAVADTIARRETVEARV